eukprot:6215579-Alexandrium_andersonii.AAC.1
MTISGRARRASRVKAATEASTASAGNSRAHRARAKLSRPMWADAHTSKKQKQAASNARPA